MGLRCNKILQNETQKPYATLLSSSIPENPTIHQKSTPLMDHPAQRPPLLRRTTAENMSSNAPELVNLMDHADDEDDDSIAPYTLSKDGTNASNAISVENYTYIRDLQCSITEFLTSSCPQVGSSSERRRSPGRIRSSGRGRAIDLSHCDEDDDYVECLNWSPAKKLLKGESSNSKQKLDGDDDNEIGASVDLAFLCDICVDKKPKSASFNILGCTHTYCSDCMATYVASKLQENATNINCPVLGCDGRLEPEHCRSILPSQVFDKWGDVLCESLILASEKFYCPFKDCSALLVDERNERNEVITQSECPNCRRLFCAQCSVPWHPDITCADFQKLNKNEREREDIMLMNLAKKKNWMRCPMCKFYVEKSQGCLFMRCRCNYTFCYNCGAGLVDHYCSNCKH